MPEDTIRQLLARLARLNNDELAQVNAFVLNLITKNATTAQQLRDWKIRANWEEGRDA